MEMERWWTTRTLLGASLAAAVTALSGIALAGPIEDGVTAYHKDDFKTARRLWQPRAERGDAAAQYWMGIISYSGGDQAPDPAAAMRWFRRAADQGHAGGQAGVGHLYRQGAGVPNDLAEAARWYLLAVKRRGNGKPSDSDQSAARELGRLYRDGAGVNQDLLQAWVWLRRAQLMLHRRDPGRVNIQDELAALEARMTPAQKAEAARLVEAWLRGEAP